MSNATIKRHISRTLYTLKRRWPTPVQLHSVSGEPVTDHLTGNVEYKETTIRVRKAIELPRSDLRKFVYDLAYIATGKNFTYGGLFDQATRVIIVDSRDLPKLHFIRIDDEATVDGERFQVNTTTELPFRTGFMVGLVRSHAGDRLNDTY